MEKNKTTQKVRTASRAIINEITQASKQGVRKLGEVLGLSKSSVHRHLQAQSKRDQHPESAYWETEAGYAWLRLLVFAVKHFVPLFLIFAKMVPCLYIP